MEYADLKGITRATVYNHIRIGKIKAVREGAYQYVVVPKSL
jgi:predicted site-specific integrase-resolvase